ncbi:MAG: response regulator [Verrucomicrobia bacterium]|nr:response regulator [Verrucomicrobiota bacterium]
MSQASKSADGVPAAPAPTGQNGSMLVLVVDDNAFSRRVIVQLLQQAGFKTLEASDGAQAIQILTRTPDIRLMTLDLEMPSMNGFQVLEALRSPAKAESLKAVGNDRVPIILVTGNDTYPNRKRGFELGAADFVRKDEVQDQLVLTARLILSPATAFAGMTVLVVEDTAVARQMMVSCVRQLGVDVVDVHDGADALDLLRRRPTSVDLVLTDMHMSKVNGDELCLRVRQELGLKELPVIVLSGTSEPDVKLQLFRIGATDFLEKPFIKEELIARLSVHLKRQQLDRNLRANLVRLKELDKLKDEFLAVCSHDLRSPLSGILGFTQLLLKDPEMSPAKQDMLHRIMNAGKYLLELINDILDLGRAQAQKESMEFLPLNPIVILRQCLGNFRPTADSKRIELSMTEQPSVARATVLGNHTALSRIYTNLISNAIKFTPEGGKVFLRVSMDGGGHTLSIECEDTGIGIPESMMSKLFSRYSKVSRQGTHGERGTGLGLIITRELIESHGGQLSVHSREGQGTTFTITLPLTGTDSPPVPDQPAHEPLARSLHILAAEDDAVNMKVLEFMLKKMNHECLIVPNGQEALKTFVALQEAERFDVIVMDIEMPVMDGRQTIVAMREHERSQGIKPVPAIAVTAHTGEKERREYLKIGFNAVVSKPFKSEELSLVLEQLLAP